MLRLRGEIPLPAHVGRGGFDHGDVHRPSGLVYIAHTANATVEVVDGNTLEHIGSIKNCPEASGVLCTPTSDLVFAAARGAGKILVIRGGAQAAQSTMDVGGRPNGLAWDSRRRQLLVADVEGDSISLVAPDGRSAPDTGKLPGRPRWTLYDPDRDRFLVNIRAPAGVAVVDAATAQVESTWPVASAGPHGLDVDLGRGLAFVACDAGDLLVLDLDSGEEAGRVAIGGEPDAIWFNPKADRVYVAIGDPGILQSVDVENMRIAGTVETEKGAKTTALDIDRQALYVFNPAACTVAAYAEDGANST